MKLLAIELPTLYGDHHVTEVRRILLELPGVSEVYASSCFHTVEVSYDPQKMDEQAIVAKLSQSGYLGDLPMPAETGEAAYLAKDQPVFFRHTATYETTRKVVSFAQQVSGDAPGMGRALWPCPGMGVIEKKEVED
ncbi:MAG TPA: cation transporter [Anaerolineales bacterium]